MILIQTFDNRNFTTTKNDLNFSNPPVPPLNPIEAAVVFFNIDDLATLEFKMKRELQILANNLGVDMFDRFRVNNTPNKVEPFNSGHELGKRVQSLDVFKQAHDNVRLEFEAALKKQAAAGRLDVNALEANTDSSGRFGRPQKTNPEGIKTSLDLATRFGNGNSRPSSAEFSGWPGGPQSVRRGAIPAYRPHWSTR